MKSHNLMSVAEMAISTGMGENLVFDEIAKALEGFETSQAHRMVSDFNWRLIATTNYDRFLEDAYSDTKRRRQTLVPFVKDSEPVEDRMASVTNPLQYLKLHGSIDHRLDKEVPLVLSWEQYDRYAKNRERLFERLHYLAPESVIVFVGYRLGDAHIRKLIYALDGSQRPRWYTVDPSAEDEDVAFWLTKNVEVLKCRFGEFMTALDQSIPKLLRFVTPPMATSLCACAFALARSVAEGWAERPLLSKANHSPAADWPTRSGRERPRTNGLSASLKTSRWRSQGV